MLPASNFSTKRQSPDSTITLSITLVPRPKSALRSPRTQSGIFIGAGAVVSVCVMFAYLPGGAVRPSADSRLPASVTQPKIPPCALIIRSE